MNNTIRISIIIATYKRYKKLCECLESIKNNKVLGFDNFEVIVVDDGGSLDKNIENEINTISIKFIYSTENKGSAASQTIGANYARGEILAFLDDDARIDTNWLKSIDKYFIQHPNIYAVLGRIESADTSHILTRMRQKIYDKRHQKFINKDFASQIKTKYKLNIKEDKCICNHISGGNFAIRKSLIEKIGCFRTDIRRGSDNELAERILTARFAIGYNPEMIIYHHHGKSYLGLFKNNINEGKTYIKVRYKENTNLYKLLISTIINLILVPFRIISFPEMLKADKNIVKVYLIFTAVHFFDACGRTLQIFKNMFNIKEKEAC